MILAGKFKKALSTRGGEDVRHIKINEPQNIKFTGNAIGTNLKSSKVIFKVLKIKIIFKCLKDNSKQNLF